MNNNIIIRGDPKRERRCQLSIACELLSRVGGRERENREGEREREREIERERDCVCVRERCWKNVVDG